MLNIIVLILVITGQNIWILGILDQGSLLARPAPHQRVVRSQLAGMSIVAVGQGETCLACEASLARPPPQPAGRVGRAVVRGAAGAGRVLRAGRPRGGVDGGGDGVLYAVVDGVRVPRRLEGGVALQVG